MLCRSPDVFRAAVCMSGTYDLARFFDGPVDDDFVAASPLHFLPGLDEDGALLQRLRTRFVVLATGQGANEDIGESWRAAHELGPAASPTGSTRGGRSGRTTGRPGGPCCRTTSTIC